MQTSAPRVALFVTCLVDLHRPTVGFAAIKIVGCQSRRPRYSSVPARSFLSAPLSRNDLACDVAAAESEQYSKE